MKVLYAYRYGIVGGVSTQLLLRQKALSKNGIDCQLFFSQDNGLRQILPHQRGTHFGVDIALKTLVRREAFDAVVVIDSPELLGAAAGSLWRRPSVYLDVHTTTSNGLAYLADIDVSKLAGVMVPTHYSAELVSKRVDGVVVHVVSNILNTDVFFPVEKGDPDFQGGSREFIWVGKLDNHKNWRLALVYARMLNDVLGPIRLHLVGGFTTPDSRAVGLFELAYRLGISNRINWIDRVENTQLCELYRQCSASGGAMLVTSRDESFGMAAAEALLCGCPLIANDLPVFHEVFPVSPLVNLVDVWRPEQVANAGQALMSGVSDSEVQRLYKELRRRYGAKAFVDTFMALVE